MKLTMALVVGNRIALVPVEGGPYEAVDLRTGRKIGKYLLKEGQTEFGTTDFPIESLGGKMQSVFDLMRTLSFASSERLYFMWNDCKWVFDSKKIMLVENPLGRSDYEATREILQQNYEEFVNRI
jgi:hypothetical protein